ncbi:MAG: hypothetical protein IJD39_11540 [Clostridia bacterium]|nr:hypothetical protein [Clostridia bacterium]
MKKLIALLMILTLSLSCTGAMAEAAPQQAYSAHFTLSFDEDMLYSLLEMEKTEENAADMEMILPLLRNLGGKVIASEEGGEMSLTLNGASLCTLGVYYDEEKMTMLSDLFPNYALTMPRQQMPEISEEELMAVITPQINSIVSGMKNRITGTENGAYEFEGVTFDTKVTIEIPASECVMAVADVMQALLTNETVIKLLTSMGEADMLNEALKEIEDAKAAPTDDLTGGLIIREYTQTGTQNQYFDIHLQGAEVVLALQGGLVEGKVYLQLLAGEDVFLNQEQMIKAAKQYSGDAVLIRCVATPGASQYDMDLQMDLYAGTYLGMHVKAANNRMMGYMVNVSFSLVPGGDPLMNLSALIRTLPDGQFALKGTLTPTETISLDPATVDTASEEYQTALYNLGNDIGSFGLNTLLANAAMAMPEEVSALITYLMAPPETTESYTFDGVTD